MHKGHNILSLSRTLRIGHRILRKLMSKSGMHRFKWIRDMLKKFLFWKFEFINYKHSDNPLWNSTCFKHFGANAVSPYGTVYFIIGCYWHRIASFIVVLWSVATEGFNFVNWYARYDNIEKNTCRLLFCPMWYQLVCCLRISKLQISNFVDQIRMLFLTSCL